MGTADQKRKRSRNFTVEEEFTLVNLVADYKEIIENKKSDAVTWKDKERTWNTIAELFAAKTGTSREMKTLRDKYDCLKRRTKIELAAEKSETYRSGGRLTKSGVSSVSQQIAIMLGDSVTGINNIFDGDNAMCESVDSMGRKEDISISANDFASGSEQEQEIGETTHTEDYTRTHFDWGDWTPISLQHPQSKRYYVGAKRKRTLEESKVELTLAQKNFYDQESRRAEEKHKEENRRAEEKLKEENRRAEEKHKEENRRAEEKHQEELVQMRLQIDLLKLELLKKQKEIRI